MAAAGPLRVKQQRWVDVGRVCSGDRQGQRSSALLSAACNKHGRVLRSSRSESVQAAQRECHIVSLCLKGTCCCPACRHLVLSRVPCSLQAPHVPCPLRPLAAPLWPCRTPTCCCWMSPPITWTWRPYSGWRVRACSWLAVCSLCALAASMIRVGGSSCARCTVRHCGLLDSAVMLLLMHPCDPQSTVTQPKLHPPLLTLTPTLTTATFTATLPRGPPT